MNATFRVCELDSGQAYVLRIHPTTWYNEQTIGSELAFLDALRVQTELLASKPVRASDGTYVIRMTQEGIPQPRCCVLFEWLEGEFFSSTSATDIQEIGSYLARLHAFGQQFQPPEGFIRPRLDANGLFSTGGMFYPHGGEKVFTAEQKAFFAHAQAEISLRMAKIPWDAENITLVHGDYYLRNILRCGDQIGAIDFDTCGWGYRAYDMLVSCWTQEWDDDEAQELFLKGYQSVLPLPHGLRDIIPLFTAVRSLMDAYWFASRQEHPDLRQYSTSVIAEAVHKIKAALQI